MMPAMGATPTDFLGNQIFTVDFGDGMMIPMDTSISFAVGGGYAFFGMTHSVENALRTIANPVSVATRSMNSATSLIDHTDVSGWGYGNPAKSMEIQMAVMENMSTEMFDDAEALDFDPEMAAELRAEFEEELELQKALMKTLSVFLGPMAWNMTADDSGITSEIVMVRPSAE